MVGSPNGEYRSQQIRCIGQEKAAPITWAQRRNPVKGTGGPRMREMPTQWKTQDVNHPEMRRH